MAAAEQRRVPAGQVFVFRNGAVLRRYWNYWPGTLSLS
jgi:hypothetical protein